MFGFDVPYIWYVVLWLGIIISVPVAVVMTLIHLWNDRERRDGKR